jgi:hypothetical protein
MLKREYIVDVICSVWLLHISHGLSRKEIHSHSMKSLFILHKYWSYGSECPSTLLAVSAHCLPIPIGVALSLVEASCGDSTLMLSVTTFISLRGESTRQPISRCSHGRTQHSPSKDREHTIGSQDADGRREHPLKDRIEELGINQIHPPRTCNTRKNLRAEDNEGLDLLAQRCVDAR